MSYSETGEAPQSSGLSLCAGLKTKNNRVIPPDHFIPPDLVIAPRLKRVACGMFAIETDREADDRWIAEIPALPGVLAYGGTRAEAIARTEALALRVLADRLDNGEPVPRATACGVRRCVVRTDAGTGLVASHSRLADATRVPIEYVGLARAFRARIADADAIAIKVFQQTSQQLMDRARRHPVPRADILSAVARAWRSTVPAFGRLDQRITLKGKWLSISETRCIPQHYRQAEWEDDAREPGVSVVRIGMSIAPRRELALAMYTLCSASLHALARRYQRGQPTNDDAIIADLHALAAAHERLRVLPEGSGFTVDVASGRWLGNVLDIRSHDSGVTQRVPSARTFVEA